MKKGIVSLFRDVLFIFALIIIFDLVTLGQFAVETPGEASSVFVHAKEQFGNADTAKRDHALTPEHGANHAGMPEFQGASGTQAQVLALLSPKSPASLASTQCPARLCAEAEKQIYDINAHLRTYLVPLLSSLYFKYVKLDLSRQCPFWQSESVCKKNHCAIDTNSFGAAVNSGTGGILDSWKNQKNLKNTANQGTSSNNNNNGGATLGSITFPSRQSTIFSSWRDNPLDFALLDNEATTSTL